MKLAKNILLNYLGQIYVAIVGIIAATVYFSKLGPEAYGIIGLYVLIQVWFQLLDFGLTSTVSRLVARFHNGSYYKNEFIALYKKLQLLFLIIGIVAVSLASLTIEFFLTDWLNFSKISYIEVQYSLHLMVVIIFFRWLGGLFRGLINGSELFLWLNIFNSCFASLKIIAFLLADIFYSVGILGFFCVQLLIASLELIILNLKARAILKNASIVNIDNSGVIKESLTLKGIINFSLTLAFTNTLWAICTQADKIFLSKLLEMSEYGIFSLVVVLANGITLLSFPIISALQPRLTSLLQTDFQQYIDSFFGSVQLITRICVGVAIFIAFNSHDIMFTWTGSTQIASTTATLLGFYAIGNGLAVYRQISYLLQYAAGNLKLYVTETITFIIFLLPSLYYFVSKYGFVGTGYCWFMTQLIFAIFWTPMVQKKLLGIVYYRRIFKNIVEPVLIMVFANLIVKLIVDNMYFGDSQVTTFIGLSLKFLLVLSVIVVHYDRKYLKQMLDRRL